MLETIEVTTDDLAGLNAAQKVRRVHERLENVVGSLCDMYASGDVGDAGRLRLSAGPDIVVGVMSGMGITCERTAAHIASHDDDALFVQPDDALVRPELEQLRQVVGFQTGGFERRQMLWFHAGLPTHSTC